MSRDELEALAARVAEIQRHAAASGKILHDVINEGIASLEHLRDLREQHAALVADVEQLAADIASAGR